MTISTDIPPATPPPTPAATASAVSTPLKDQIESPQLSSPVASAATPTSTVAFEDADTEGRIGSGNFRKKGANVKNWKVRKYIIKRDGTLLYLDPSNGALKGTLSCKIIELYKGNPKNIDESGCTILTHNDTGFALDLHIIDGSRKLEVVFDSVSDAQTFVEFLRVVATSHNIPVCCIYFLVIFHDCCVMVMVSFTNCGICRVFYKAQIGVQKRPNRVLLVSVLRNTKTTCLR